MTMNALPDRRALAFQDEPFSAYCRVCWNAVYVLWIDGADHHRGACIHGVPSATDCPEARACAFNTRQVQRLRRALAEDIRR